MSTVSPPVGQPLATSSSRPHPGSRSLGWWGVVLLICTEATLFGLLLFVNFYLRANAGQWPPKGIEDPELVKTSIRTVILLGSSLPIALGERACRRGDQRAFRRWVATAFTMGALFLAGHVQEYIELWPKFTIHTNAYGSIFYTLTGLHALHLIVGMVVLAYLYVQSSRGRYDGDPEPNSVAAGSLYWHFVDAVWVAVFTSLYLSVTLA